MKRLTAVIWVVLSPLALSAQWKMPEVVIKAAETIELIQTIDRNGGPDPYCRLTPTNIATGVCPQIPGVNTHLQAPIVAPTDTVKKVPYRNVEWHKIHVAGKIVDGVVIYLEVSGRRLKSSCEDPRPYYKDAKATKPSGLACYSSKWDVWVMGASRSGYSIKPE